MKDTELRAKLLLMPVKIEEIFFSSSDFKVHPLGDEAEPKISMEDIEFSSSLKVLEEAGKRVQVSVRIRTKRQRGKAFEFEVSCIGIYKWEGDKLGDEEIRNIYGWGVSIQTSAIRLRISEELSRSPYHEVWYFPLSLVKIESTN